MHICGNFLGSLFVAIYGVFETRRERAAGTLFLSVLLERNTLPLTGCGWLVGGGWWVVAGWLVGWLAGCLVWIIGFDIYMYTLHAVQGRPGLSRAFGTVIHSRQKTYYHCAAATWGSKSPLGPAEWPYMHSR